MAATDGEDDDVQQLDALLVTYSLTFSLDGIWGCLISPLSTQTQGARDYVFYFGDGYRSAPRSTPASVTVGETGAKGDPQKAAQQKCSTQRLRTASTLMRWCWRSRRAAESRANWGCKMWINLGWRLFVGGREGFLETLETIFRQAKSPAAGRRWHIFRYTNAAVVLCGFYVLGLRYSLAKIWSKPF